MQGVLPKKTVPERGISFRDGQENIGKDYDPMSLKSDPLG
jgi:hypothetical protein